MFSFFVNSKKQNSFLIEGQDLHHLKNVVKLQAGSQIFCVFQSEKYLCTISEITDTFCRVEIVEKVPTIEKKVRINLYAGIIREQKWDFVLQKATELGVDQIFPVEFQRNVVRIETKKIVQKVERWQQICVQAAKQSKRTNIPVVNSVIKDLAKITVGEKSLNLVAWEETTMSLKQHLQTDFSEINIVIGPEGGISSSEIACLEKLGFHKVGLGENILRAETASLFLISAINYEKDL